MDFGNLFRTFALLWNQQRWWRVPTMIHQWRKALLEGAVGIFERGGRTAATEIDEDTVRPLPAKIGD